MLVLFKKRHGEIFFLLKNFDKQDEMQLLAKLKKKAPKRTAVDLVVRYVLRPRERGRSRQRRGTFLPFLWLRVS